MVAPIYVFRVAALVVAAILAVIVLALSAQSSAAVKHIDQEIFPGGIELDPSQFRYPNIGIASGAMTIVSVPILILSDLITAGCPIVVELLWFTVTWILFAVTGGLALKEAHTFSSGLAELNFGSCNDLSQVGSDFVTLCRDARPLGIVAILAMGMLLVYTLTLLAVAAVGTGLWLGTIKPSGSTERA